MKKRFTILTVFVLLLTCILSSCSACSKEEEAPKTNGYVALSGTWKGTGDEISTVTFTMDGSYRDDAGSIVIVGSYVVNSAEQTVTVTDEEDGLVFTYHYEVDGNNLTLQLRNGLPRTFTKQ